MTIVQDGKRYVDFLAGWCVGNFGWNNPRLERARRSFNGPDYVYPNDSYAPWEELAGLLARIAPAGLNMCYRATGGSEAVDMRVPFARLATVPVYSLTPGGDTGSGDEPPDDSRASTPASSRSIFRAWAVVQLRAENRYATSYNMVGFQTRLAYPEQKRIFSLVPALARAEFLRYGSIHRNSYINSPASLTPAPRD